MRQFILFLGLLFLVVKINAQALSDLNVVVYPEYYNSGIMIEYSGTVDESVLPKTVRFLMPTDTDSIFIIMNNEEEEIVEPLSVTPIIDGTESWATVELMKKNFRLFAFSPPFSEPSGDRSYEFTFQTDQNLSVAHIVVQEPMNGERFRLEPEDSEPFTDQHGLTFHRFHIDNILAMTKKTVRIRYTNPTGMTTVQALQGMLASDDGSMITPNTQGSLSNNQAPERYSIPTWQPLTVLLVFAAVVGYLVVKSKKNTVGQPQIDENGKFCPQCGKPTTKTDKFCPHCGHKLQK
ncbi:MAG: zinc ribbon domain-containing protein [Candidatus Neomarinimicrobiota bacterium]